MRFLEACCHAHDSLSQEARKVEGERQLRELGSLRREIRTWLVRHDFHDVVLADPLEAAGAAKSVEKARELMYDAVHMKPAGYAALAGKIRELAQQWMMAKKRKGDAIAQPAGKRAKLEPTSGSGSGPGGPSGSASGKKKGGPYPPRSGPKGAERAEGRGRGGYLCKEVNRKYVANRFFFFPIIFVFFDSISSLSQFKKWLICRHNLL